MNTMLEKTQELKTSILCFGAQTRAVVREVCTFEFLGLATMLLPALMASVGFFFGKTVSPVYFWSAVAILTCAAFLVGWRRGLAYLALLAVCTVLTMYTFSYSGTDAQNYHFPMQYLLHHGWNPVFDSTVEKFAPLIGDAQASMYHTLFLPKFCALCGAIVASAFHLFAGDGFLGYILIVCLFSTCMTFAKRYWTANAFLCVLFASGMTFSTKITSFLAGQVDYSTYASFCISMLSLVLYIRDRRLSDLLLFSAATCICVASKSTGVLCCGVLVIMTLPLLFNRVGYWRALFWTGVVFVIVGASPILTAWVQYGSPFYPSMTFNPNVEVVDITNDFTGNADALSMGYLSRICYAWVSPKLTIAAIRLLDGRPDFNPVFSVCGGVSGLGLWFNGLLLTSAVLLAVSRKNLITWLCIVIFVSSNFAPLKYLGYGRYFPQIWTIFPLAVLNFTCTTKETWRGRDLQVVRKGVVLLLVVALGGVAGLSFLRTLAYQGRVLAYEGARQSLIASFQQGDPIRVGESDYRFTTVRRFRQAGLHLVKSTDGQVDTIMQQDTALPRHDVRPDVCASLNARFPICDSIKSLLFKFHWLDVFDNLPHVLWDDNAKEILR